MPVAIETFGPFGPKSPDFVNELGSRIRQETGEEMTTSYLIQRLFMVIERENVTAVLGLLVMHATMTDFVHLSTCF